MDLSRDHNDVLTEGFRIKINEFETKLESFKKPGMKLGLV